jgi:hypothetical protein
MDRMFMRLFKGAYALRNGSLEISQYGLSLSVKGVVLNVCKMELAKK